MKLSLFIVLVGCTYALRCMVGDLTAPGTEGLSTACEQLVTKCRGMSMSWVDGRYTHNTPRACGECGDIADCDDCESDDCNKNSWDREDFKCTAYEWNGTAWVKKTEETVDCKKLTGSDDVCSMPIGDLDTDTLKTFCGPCRKGDEKICTNDQSVFDNVGNAHRCMVGDLTSPGTPGVSTACEPSVTKCRGMSMNWVNGYYTSNTPRACGECGDIADCDDCESNDCNKATFDREDFKCTAYEWNGTAWVKKTEETVDCKKLTGSDDVCSMPIGALNTDTLKTFCGPCRKGDETICTNDQIVFDNVGNGDNGDTGDNGDNGDIGDNGDNGDCDKSGAPGVSATVMTLIAAIFVLA